MINFIIKDIMEVAGYLPIGILSGILVVVLYVICILCLERKNRKKNRLSVHVRNSVVWFILSVYIAVMFVTVFLSREPGSRQGIDMTLFGTWGITPQAHAFVIENVLLFVPFGILCPFAVTPTGRTSDGTHSRGRIASRFTVLLGFIISVGIETVQLLMLMYGREAQSKTRIASPATIPKSGERNRKIHSCMLYLISI
jgi:glycopeptide antibiotics resistance protein